MIAHIIKIVTLYLMKHYIKKAEKRIETEENTIVKGAMKNVVKNLKTTLLYLKSWKTL